MLKVYNKTVLGEKHRQNDTVCQDWSASLCGDGYAVVVVCDGHGSARFIRSERGSQFAGEAAMECVGQFFADLKLYPEIKNSMKHEYKQRLDRLIMTVITKWQDAVRADIKDSPLPDPLSDKESLIAYGTTLICFAVCDEFCFGLQIGDGRCVTFDENNVPSQPIPWNDKCFLNITTSMCDTNVFDNFMHFFSEEVPKAVFIGTDGIDDSFGDDTRLHEFYTTLLGMFENGCFEECVNEINRFLPELSKRGSGDDVSIALVLRHEVNNDEV